MTKLDFIQSIPENLFANLLKAGLVDPVILQKRDVVFFCEAHMKAGDNKTQAVTNTADYFRLSEQTIYTYLREMKTEI